MRAKFVAALPRETVHFITDEPETTTYRFEDAPPWMCLEAAGKIPGLLEELILRTRDMREKITSKNAEIHELATVLEGLAVEAVNARR